MKIENFLTDLKEESFFLNFDEILNFLNKNNYLYFIVNMNKYKRRIIITYNNKIIIVLSNYFNGNVSYCIGYHHTRTYLECKSIYKENVDIMFEK